MKTTASLHRIDLSTPEEVAYRLRHLPGLVFLDSSSSDALSVDSQSGRFSLVTARPTRLHTGNLYHAHDRMALAAIHRDNSLRYQNHQDLGFPLQGLYGYITYEGDFIFGEYHELLVYDHLAGEWYETGRLSEALAHHPQTCRTLEPLEFRSSTTREGYCAMVEQAQAYIATGDIYQVNLAHRFSAPLPTEFCPLSQYLKLRQLSPSPYAAYCHLDQRHILCSSPEQFLSLSGRHIQTRPIKGTRPRFHDREMDEKSAYDLITSTKEVAELVMITDLERNDLGQICDFGSVEATELLKLERFAQVFHLVSTVRGVLRPEVEHVEAIHACFPGGSITGAPKKRAREIITELEASPRGLYTGTVGCLGFNGESRLNIAIRTAVVEDNQLHFHVGAGIVADSVPQWEWEETLHKARGILSACGASNVLASR